MLVSIIVPAHNEAHSLPGLLTAFLNQDFPQEHFEVIVIDNCSSDGTTAVAESFKSKIANERGLQITVLQENSVANSDAARNKGIDAARGQYLAFTDGDCLPAQDWLKMLLATAQNAQKAQNEEILVAGKIEFSLPPRPTGAEVYDSMSFLNHEVTVRDRSMAFTANLLVPKSVAVALGGFPTDTPNVGDGYFSKLCSRHGFIIRYEPLAIVTHPPRRLRQLIAKGTRIGRVKGSKGPYSSYQAGNQKSLVDRISENRRLPHILSLNPFRVRTYLIKRRLHVSSFLCLRTSAAGATIVTCGMLAYLGAALKTTIPKTRLYKTL